MYAIVDIAGQQFKVENNQKLYVHKLEKNEGEKVVFKKILLLDNGKEIAIGLPTLEKASVTATILEHLKGDKVIVFKKKRRKGYKVKNGHRQHFTSIQINNISIDGTTVKAVEKSKSDTKSKTSNTTEKTIIKPKVAKPKKVSPKSSSSASKEKVVSPKKDNTKIVLTEKKGADPKKKNETTKPKK